MSTTIINVNGLTLTIREAELYWLAAPEELQKQIAIQLINFFGKSIRHNKQKALEYLKKHAPDLPIDVTNLNSTMFFTLSGSYNTVRNLIIRFNRFINSTKIANAFLTRYFAIAGLFFFIELAYDLFLISKEAYEAMDKPREGLSRFAWVLNRIASFWNCFKVAFKSDQKRLSRMANAAFWGPVNLIAFIFAAPWVTGLTTFGFAFDVLNDYLKYRYQINEYESLISKLNEHQNLTDDEKATREALVTKLASLKKEKNKTLFISSTSFVCIFVLSLPVLLPFFVMPLPVIVAAIGTLLAISIYATANKIIALYKYMKDKAPGAYNNLKVKIKTSFEKIVKREVAVEMTAEPPISTEIESQKLPPADVIPLMRPKSVIPNSTLLTFLKTHKEDKLPVFANALCQENHLTPFLELFPKNKDKFKEWLDPEALHNDIEGEITKLEKLFAPS